MKISISSCWPARSRAGSPRSALSATRGPPAPSLPPSGLAAATPKSSTRSCPAMTSCPSGARSPSSIRIRYESRSHYQREGSIMIRTGEEYRQSLADGREVWIDGEQVKDVTTHPAFKPIVDVRARIYDLAHEPRTAAAMTYVDDATGETCAIGGKPPKTKQDWRAKHAAVETVLDEAGGVGTRVNRIPTCCCTSSARQITESWSAAPSSRPPPPTPIRPSSSPPSATGAM